MQIPDKIKSKIPLLARQYYHSIFPDVEFLKEMEKLRSLTIETCNICNANCVFCGYRYMERKKQIINDDTFKKAIDDFVVLGGGNLSMTVVVGDPLLDPKFVNRIQYARFFHTIKKISTSTNCLNLHKVGAKKLLKSGLSDITISMTGFDADMHERIFRSNRYEQMKRNVLDLLRTNNELGRLVKISIALRIDKPVEDVTTYPGFEEVVKLADSVGAPNYYDSWSGRIKPEDLSGNMKIRSLKLLNYLKRKNPCSMMYSGVGVLVDGTVTVCPCRDLNGDSDLVIGNINRAPLNAIYYSKHLEKLRNDWFSGKYIPDICRDCRFYNLYTHLMISEVRKQLVKDWREQG